MSRAFSAAALALVGASFCACGPVEYVAQVGSRASTALAQARRERADQLAPYEYTAAGEYLKKSREEASRSQFETALEYGKLSEELAGRARALSRERKAGRGWGQDPAGSGRNQGGAPAPEASPDEAGGDGAGNGADESAPARGRRSRGATGRVRSS